MLLIPEEIRKVNPGISDQELSEYIDKVWELCEKLRPGQKLIIKEIARSYPTLFIECVKDYMRNHPWQGGLSFDSGFESVRKYVWLVEFIGTKI